MLTSVLGTSADFVIPPQMQVRIDYLRQQPTLKSRVEAIDLLVQKLRDFAFTPLGTALEKSELTSEQIEKLSRNSRGLITMTDLLRHPVFSEGYSLGLSIANGEYRMLSERMNLMTWHDSYPEFGIDWKANDNHTELFMEKLTVTEKPVVFFIPNRILTHEKAGFTKKELQWLLDRPQKMRHVLYVFGAYDFLNAEIEALRVAAGFSRDELCALVMRALGHGFSTCEQSI